MRILLLAACLLAISIAVAAQGTPVRPALITFTSLDGAFSFRYSDILIRCEQHPQAAGGGHYWTPAACTAYGEVCDPVQDQITLVCFAYPRNKHTNTPAFQAAAFSVAEIKAATEKDCLAGSQDLQADTGRDALIHGVRFKTFTISGAGLSNGFDATVHRTFHNGTCYQLGIADGYSNPHVFDPPVRDMSKSDWKEVQDRLEQARDSFEFLK